MTLSNRRQTARQPDTAVIPTSQRQSTPATHPDDATRQLLDLQTEAGNQAVATLIHSQLTELEQEAVVSFAQTLLDTAPAAPLETMPAEGGIMLHDLPGGQPLQVHRGGIAGELLADAGTAAASVGSHIVLAPDAPSLTSREGQQLLAHEAVHTAQQRGDMPEPRSITAQQRSAEAEADQAAAKLMRGAAVAQPSYAPMIHFQGGGAVVQAVAKKALKWLAKRGKNVSAHIAKRHVARRLGKSRFSVSGAQIKKWVTRTLEAADNVVDQGRRIVFEKQFGNEVGRAGERIVRVVVDKATGKIVTAFPTQAFKQIVSAVAVGLVTARAGEADAAVLARRKAIQEAEAARENWFTTLIDFLVAPSRVARDEDIIAEQRIIDRKINEAIESVEREEQRSLNPEEKAEVREIILIEMETEPEAG